MLVAIPRSSLGRVAWRRSSVSLPEPACRLFASAEGVADPGAQLPLSQVPIVQSDLNLYEFRHHHFIPELPLVIRGAYRSPAALRWFHRRGRGLVFSSRLTKHSRDVFPFELSNPPGGPSQVSALGHFRQWLIHNNSESHVPLFAMVTDLLNADDAEHEFRRVDLPLAFLARACQFNAEAAVDRPLLQNIYIAQSKLSDLPKPLQDDLPAPHLVMNAGKGDIYDSSIWLGLEPTNTPLHRDPNPNLFVQITGTKSVTLMAPKSGDALFGQVRQALGQPGNTRMRGSEMMEGREKEALDRAVWSPGAPGNDFIRAVLRPGDAMFIPKGWWHSIKSTGSGQLNASANWWFR